jgi:hypothetical protein
MKRISENQDIRGRDIGRSGYQEQAVNPMSRYPDAPHPDALIP